MSSDVTPVNANGIFPVKPQNKLQLIFFEMPRMRIQKTKFMKENNRKFFLEILCQKLCIQSCLCFKLCITITLITN